jgi:hypothetical protein
MEAQASAKGRLAELGDDTDAELRRTEVVMLHFDRA